MPPGGQKEERKRLVRKLISLSWREGVFTLRLPYWLPLLQLPTCVFSPFSLPPKLYSNRREISTVSTAGLPNAQRQSCSARRLPVRCQNIPCQKLTLWPVDCSLKRRRTTEFCLSPCRPGTVPALISFSYRTMPIIRTIVVCMYMFPHILFHRDKGANVSQS